MADKKDFLDQFSNSGKPASFQEEERIVIKKERKPVNKVVLIIVITVLLLAAGLSYFVFLAPKIEMPNFVYQTKTDVVAWVKQQGIETTGIIFNEEYNFDYDEGVVLSQSVKEGSKVKQDVKLTFLLSKGADPDELISVPDIQSMSKQDIKDWISENKLTKTKISTSYSETVDEDEVIDFKFTGCDEDSFTRSSTLKINVSKGPAPAGKVTVNDFLNKPYSTVETWAKENKVELSKTEDYSDKVEKGLVVSQSISSGKAINEGETLYIVVSKGKAIVMEDFSTYKDEKEIENWGIKNGVTVNIKKHYAGEDIGTVISQTPKAGTNLSEGDYIEVIVSLGTLKESKFFEKYSEKADKQALKEWIAEINKHGLDFTIGHGVEEYSDTVAKDNIISIEFDDDKQVVNYVRSKGKYLLINDDNGSYGKWSNALFKELIKHAEDHNKIENDWLDEDDIKKLCDHLGITYEIVYDSSDDVAVGYAIKIDKLFNDSFTDFNERYIGQDEVVTIVICNNNSNNDRFDYPEYGEATPAETPAGTTE